MYQERNKLDLIWFDLEMGHQNSSLAVISEGQLPYRQVKFCSSEYQHVKSEKDNINLVVAIKKPEKPNHGPISLLKLLQCALQK